MRVKQNLVPNLQLAEELLIPPFPLFEARSHYAAQAGLQVLSSSNHLTSASQVAHTTERVTTPGF
jgi:hypothetical protein